MAFKLLRFKDRDSFFAHFARVFRNLQLFTDVRIYCSDGILQAHRIVLSTASPFLKQVLLDSEDHECSILIMKDFSSRVMEALFSFLYTGCCVLPSAYAGELLALTTNIGMDVHNIDLDLGSEVFGNTKHKTAEWVDQRKESEHISRKPFTYEKQSKRFRSSNRSQMSNESGSTTSYSSPSLGQSPSFHLTPPRPLSVRESPLPESNHSPFISQLPRAHYSSSGLHRSSTAMPSPKSHYKSPSTKHSPGSNHALGHPHYKSPSIKHSPGSNHALGHRYSPGLGHSSSHTSSIFLPLLNQSTKTDKFAKKRGRKKKSDASVSLSPFESPQESPVHAPFVEVQGTNRGRPRGKGRPRIEHRVESQVCGLCACVDPPSATANRTKWVGCNCGRWFHLRCLGLEEAPKSIKCSQWNKKCLPKPKPVKPRHYHKHRQVRDDDDDEDDDDEDEEEEDYRDGDWRSP